MDKHERMSRAFCCQNGCICEAKGQPRECWALDYFGPRMAAAIAAGDAWDGKRRRLSMDERDDSAVRGDIATALVALASRLREAEQERDRWRKLALEDHEPVAESRGTGVRRCMATIPADHCTGGYRVVRDEEWRQAQRDFG